LINLLFQAVQMIHLNLLIEVAANSFAIHHLVQFFADRFNGLPGYRRFNQHIEHYFGAAFVPGYLEGKVPGQSFNRGLPRIFIG
jgi:hypothetical protein